MMRLSISIHAPLAGSDIPFFTRGSFLHYFNPRSPRGERQPTWLGDYNEDIFQSTLPSRGATHERKTGSISCWISIHAPLAGSDKTYARYAAEVKDFNPRSPRGERRFTDICILTLLHISIHAPLAGSDHIQPAERTAGTYFNPRSPRGERRAR